MRAAILSSGTGPVAFYADLLKHIIFDQAHSPAELYLYLDPLAIEDVARRESLVLPRVLHLCAEPPPPDTGDGIFGSRSSFHHKRTYCWTNRASYRRDAFNCAARGAAGVAFPAQCT